MLYVQILSQARLYHLLLIATFERTKSKIINSMNGRQRTRILHLQNAIHFRIAYDYAKLSTNVINDVSGSVNSIDILILRDDVASNYHI